MLGASLRCLRFALPRCARWFALARVERDAREPGLRRPDPCWPVHCRGHLRASQVPGGPLCTRAMFSDPGGRLAPGCYGARLLPRLPKLARLPLAISLSGLDRTAHVLAVYASTRAVARTRRKTRFRLVASRCRVRLVTHRVHFAGFGSGHDLPPRPGLAWRNYGQSRNSSALVSAVVFTLGGSRYQPWIHTRSPAWKGAPSAEGFAAK